MSSEISEQPTEKLIKTEKITVGKSITRPSDKATKILAGVLGTLLILGLLGYLLYYFLYKRKQCSTSNLTGNCKDKSKTCLAGRCEPITSLCSLQNFTGLCANPKETCIGGHCHSENQLCSVGNPTGLCRFTNQTCKDGLCVDISPTPSPQPCSTSNPTGLCPGAGRCQGGLCVYNFTISETDPIKELKCDANNDLKDGGYIRIVEATFEAIDSNTNCTPLNVTANLQVAINKAGDGTKGKGLTINPKQIMSLLNVPDPCPNKIKRLNVVYTCYQA